MTQGPSRGRWQFAAVALAVVLGCALVGGRTSRIEAAEPPLAIRAGEQAPAPLPVAADGALDGSLRELAVAARGLGGAARGADLAGATPGVRVAVAAGRLRIDGDAVQVDIEWWGAEPPLAALAAAGARVEREDRAQRVVQALVPAAALERLAATAGVRRVRPPWYAHVRAGSRLTEGDALLGIGALRSSTGLDGSGVCVGVISDGIFGIGTAAASGDLPPTTLARDGTGKLVGTTGGVIAQSFRADGDLEAGIGGPPARGAEGTALLEIVHDLAPGAQLRFANLQTHLEFNAAVDALAAVCDVVVDDIGFFGWPGDGTSPVSRNTADALNDPANRVRAHVTAVGNEALDHYEDAYRADATDVSTVFVTARGKLHRFEATAGTENRAGFAGPSVNNAFRLAAGVSASVWLTWNDPIGASANDYDMVVVRRDGGGMIEQVWDGLAVQDGDDDPREAVLVTNTTGVEAQFDILVWNKNDAAASRTLELFVHGARHSYAGGAALGWLTPGGSIIAQSDAGDGVLALGAINASDPGTDDLASYSSRGPTNDGRMKPDAVAVDGVAITGAGGFGTPFFGTSAAAPHGGALAALLLQAHPRLRAGAPSALDPSAARTALGALITGSTVDLGAAGPDQLFGAGRIDGVRAGALPGPAQRLEFATQPGGATAGVPFVVQPVMRIVDGLGRLVVTSSAAVTLAIAPGSGVAGATLGGATTVQAVGGVATFSGLRIDRAGAGYVLVATASGLDAASSAPFTVGSATGTRITVQVQPGGAVAGAPFGVQPVLELRDDAGALVAGAVPVSVAIRPGSGAAGAVLLGTTTVTASGGVATFADLRIDHADAGYVLVASADGASVETAVFSVAPGVASRLRFAVEPGDAAAGSAFAQQPAVEVLDSSGNRVTSAIGSVTLGIRAGSGTAGASLLGTTSVAAVAGVASFSELRIDRAGTGYVLAAAAGALAAAESTPFDVVEAGAEQIVIVQQPADTIAGRAIAGLRAELRDGAGSLVSAPVAVTARIAVGTGAPGALLQGTTSRTSAGGVVSFDDLRIDAVAAGYVLALTAGAATANSAPFAVLPDVPAALGFATQPGGAVAGAAFAQQPVVELRDAFGNLAAAGAGTVTVAIASGPAGGALLGATTVQAVEGVASFAGLRVDVAGTYTLAASAPGLAGATSGTFVVAHGAASRLRFEVEPGGAVTGVSSRAVFAQAPVVRVEDAFGNLASSAVDVVTVRIAAGTGVPGAALTGTTVRVAAGGRVTFDDLRIDRPGAGYALVATAPGLIEGRSALFDVALGAPRALFVRVQPANGVGGERLLTQPVFELRDGDGNLTDGVVTVTLKPGAGVAGARLSGTLTVASAGGVAAFADVAIDRAGGGYVLVASAPGVTPIETAPFTVGVGPAARLAFETQPTGGTVAGGLSPQPVVVVTDAGGNRVPNATPAVRLAIKPGSGVAGATLGGTTSVTAVGGRATFGGLTIAVAGAGYVLTASADGLGSAESAPFAVTAAAGGGGGGGTAPIPAPTPTATPSPTPTPAATTRTQAGGVVLRTRPPAVATLSATTVTTVTGETAGARVRVSVPPRALSTGATVSLAGLDDVVEVTRQAPVRRGEALLAAWVIEAADGRGAPVDAVLASEATIEAELAGRPLGALDDELVVAFWDGASWVPLASEVVRGPGGVLAVVGATGHFSLFAVVHAPRRDVAIAEGWTLVVWGGADGAATADELARIRGPAAVTAVFRTDAAGGWEWHIVGAPAFAQRGLGTLRDGQAVLVRSPAAGIWRLPLR